MAASEEIAAAVKRVTETAGGDWPEAVFWFCRDGGTRRMTMTECDPPCAGCDCGYAEFMNADL